MVAHNVLTEVDTTTQPLTSTPEDSQAVRHTAPNLSVIIIDADMESDPATEGTQEVTVIPSDYRNGAHQQDHPQADTSQTTTGSHRRELEDGRQCDAITLTEEEYIRKHYYDKAETSNSGIPMNMYLGLCTGHLLIASLLLAITEVQLQRKWHGMRCCDISVKTQPQADG